VAIPFRTMPAPRNAQRIERLPGWGRTARAASSDRPTITTFAMVPTPGRWRRGIQSSSTTAPAKIVQTPIGKPEATESP
jgi:hypothetical protein